MGYRKKKKDPKLQHSANISFFKSDYDFLRAEHINVNELVRLSVEQIVKQLRIDKQERRNIEMALMEIAKHE